jgi:dTDP-4-dehydrorhamnose 3,5-epimerase
MIFTESPLPGAYVVDMQRLPDERGFFARSYCADEFAARGLGPELRQCSVSYNARKGTLRGMHYQVAPHE